MLVGVIYRSTASDIENNDKLLQAVENMMKLNDITHYLIMGDFNVPEIKWNEVHIQGDSNSYPNRFYDRVNDAFLYQHVQNCTRFRIDQEPSLLDLIFTNEESMVDNLQINAPLGKSDHASLLWTFYCYADVNAEETVTGKMAWYKADFKSINEQFGAIDWESKFDNMNVEQSWNVSKMKYGECVDNFVPQQTLKTQRKQPWFRKRVKDAVRKKNILFKKYDTSKRYVDKLAYVNQRNETGKVITNAKRIYESEIMRSVKKEPKKFYSYVKSKQKVNIKVSNLKKTMGL